MNAGAAPRAGRREWIGLAVIALPCLLYSMDLTVLELAVPKLSADLEPTSSQLLWIMDIYGFLLAGCLITMGTLGDRIGRRRLLLIGAAAFGVASVLAAFSRSAEMLIATRALLGIAGATLAPSTLSLIRNMFLDPGSAHLRHRSVGYELLGRRRDRPAGRRVSAGALLVGICVPAGRAGDGAAARAGTPLLPEFRDPRRGRLDLTSAALSLAAVLAVIYGLKRRPGRPGMAASALGRGRGCRRRRVRAQATNAGRSADRPRAFPGAGL